jgi:predicted DNA-binding ribbon-helix-helix protein
MKSAVIKRSVVVDGHKTSVSLEDQFWDSLKQLADETNMPLSKLIGQIDHGRTRGNLSSAIRLFVLSHFQAQCAHLERLDAPKLAPSVVLERLQSV